MTGKATVVSASESTAVVLIRKQSACGHDCGECRLCSNPSITTTVSNPIGAKAGDEVIIGTDTGKILGAAFLLYVMPVFAAIVLSAIVYNHFGTAPTAICTMLWVVLWFLFMRRFSASDSIKSTILEVINEEN